MAAAARAVASASSSAAAAASARYSLLALLLSRRSSVTSSAGVSPLPRSRPSPLAAPHAVTPRTLNQIRCMVNLSGGSTSETSKQIAGHTEAVKGWYEKMLKSVEAETMPPNAWLWSLIENCSNREDIKLLFQMLQNLRRFRLSNLRIHANFNCHLCRRVTEACARANALDYGKKALWKHNVYGLTPSIGSAHCLLLYAKEHNDPNLMVDVMRLLRRNSLPLQSGTADLVFSICCNTDRWDLISKYSKIFIKTGVKLHRAAFDSWMEFAAKIGNAESIWEIEKLRSNTVKQHTVSSAFSCAKGSLLEHNPESAAAIIHVLNQSLGVFSNEVILSITEQNLPDEKKLSIANELQKLVSEWPVEAIKRQKKENRKVLANSLKNDIPKMISSLLNLGSEVAVNLEELKY